MKLSNLNLVLDFPTFRGICKFSVRKEFHKLVLVGELYQINFTSTSDDMNNQIMESITKKCNDDPFMDNIFNSVNVQRRKEIIYTFQQLEELDLYLQCIDKFDKDVAPQNLNLIGFKVILNIAQMRRMRRFVYSFLWNYNIINDTLNYFVDTVDKAQKPKISEEKITDQVLKDKPEINTLEIKTTKNSLIEEILKFNILPQVSSHLIHLILNYYRYYDDVDLEYNNDCIHIKSPSIFTSTGIYNINYMRGLCNSIKKLSIDNVTLVTKNIISFIKNREKELDSIHIKILIYILMINYIRYAFDTHNEWMEQNIEKLITTPSIQTNMMNNFTKKIVGENIINFNIFQPVGDNFETDVMDDKDLSIISNKFKHLISVSQDEFAELVFKDLERNEEVADINFQTTSKTIIDINKFLLDDSAGAAENSLIDKNKYPIDYHLLKYKIGNDKIISSTYDALLNYIKSPSSILMLGDKIPNVVVKLFDILKDVLSDKYLNENIISTFEYYKILRQTIPNFKEIEFTHILFIIYQLIIPYMYDVFNITLFEDFFINLY